jgi:hypothetical protein
VKEEIERTDVARADYFAALRRLLPDGDVRAAAERQRVVMRHPDSKNSSRQVLALAALYADLAEEYVDANPPDDSGAGLCGHRCSPRPLDWSKP